MKNKNLKEFFLKKANEDYLIYDEKDVKKSKFQVNKNYVVFILSMVFFVFFVIKTYYILRMPNVYFVIKVVDIIFLFFFILLLITALRLNIVVNTLNLERFLIINYLIDIKRKLEELGKKQ